ncbi:hypothetical protein HPB50_008648 [Hyalomma asiaticum]|uniref:Uncharacterized protein n=1 Tax=Hyalomma asiaticum TaxID=266040 RepID=A0ACB7T711_HYAAI|nr:hypothetical protein HPB50_008648 [Hyalomma asiaticum]
MVSFKHGPDSTKQHLEIGCGPGGFTRSRVLQHCLPCARLVATDKAPDMIEAARKTSSHPSIHYDVLDVEAGDVEGFVKKYGQFDRIYSLLTWHFLGDQLKGYRNLRHLLKDGGECLVSACIESMFLNAWLDVFLMDKWRPFVPDPRQIFSNLTSFDCGKPHSMLASEVRKLVTDAGLHCNDCQLYESRWDFADIEETLDFAFMCFDSTARIPPEDLDEFRNAWRDRLLQKQAQPQKGFGLTFLFYVVHASK